MIYCPKCGTANRDGSRFCNECGQKLGGPTRVKCARCGAMNPVQSAFCSECGGQLLSSSEGLGADAAPTIKGLSLPTKGPAGQAEPPEARSAGEEEVPAWLRELGAARASEAGSEPGREDAAEVPDWLQDLRDSFPIEEEAQAPTAMDEQEDVPDWLARLRPAGGTEADGQPAVPEADEEELPDWLAELRPLTVEAAAGPEPDEEDEGLPDWLAELRPAARAEAHEPEAAEPEPEGEAEEEVPDWLAQLRPAARAEAPEPEAAEPEPEGEAEEVPDWLAQLRPAARAEAPEPEAAEPEPEGEAEEVPDWLAQLRPAARAEAPEPEAAEPEPEGEAEEVPDWLAQLRPAARAEAPEPEAAEPEPEGEAEEVPDWLAQLRPAARADAPEPEPEPLEPEPEGEAEEEVPDWLAQLRPAVRAEAPEPEAAEPEVEGEKVPDWLAELRPAARAEAPEPEPLEPEAEGEGEEAPDWLAELRPAARVEASEPEAEQVPEPAVAGEWEGASEGEAELPDWLAELRATEEAGPEAPTGWPEEEAAEEPAEPAPLHEAAEAEIPDWLASMRPEPEAGEAAPGWLVEAPSGRDAAGPEELAPAAMPDWLHDLEPAGFENEASQPGQEEAGEGELPAWLVPSGRESEEESLARAEIPDWLLALKPAELREKGEPETPSPLVVEPVEETGLLAGLRGTLPVEMLIAQPRAVAAAEPSPAIQSDTPQARLFAQIVGRGPEVVPKPVPQTRQSLLSRLPLWITYLALLAAVTLPLLLQNPLIERTIEPPARVIDLYDTIEALEAGEPALVAFDYDPSTSEEMNVVARTVVGHLMDRGVPVVAMSLQSAGPPVAQSILEELAAERPGARFANVGLLTGQAAGVQALGQGLTPALGQAFQGTAPADEELLSGITGLDSFGLVLVLAAEPDSLRTWIEQARALQGARLAAAVSASTEPQARSYYETDPRQLLGLVAGVPGAATYEALRTGDGSVPPEMAARLDSHLAGHAVFVLVLVVGNVAYFVRRGSRGRR